MYLFIGQWEYEDLVVEDLQGEVVAQAELVEPSCVVDDKPGVDEAYFLAKVAVEHPLYP